MGAPRLKPKRLAEKLLLIRLSLGVSQDGMLWRLGLADVYLRSRISSYELGKREPDLMVVLKYARCVGVSTDVLIDDKLDLPQRILKDAKRGVTRSNAASKSKRKR